MSCVVAVRAHGSLYKPDRRRLPFASSPPLYSHLRPRMQRFRIRADAENTNEPEKEKDELYEMPKNEPTIQGKIFGSYLQLGVWIVVLTFAGLKALQQLDQDPSSVGLLLAPPAGALVLIITFLVYRFVINKEED